MKILIVAMSNSVHVARWISLFVENYKEYEIHLFPSQDFGVTHPLLKNVIIHHSFFYDKSNENIQFKGIYLKNKTLISMIRYFYMQTFPLYRKKQLKKLIDTIHPDIIHSLEIQHGAYLVLDIKKKMKKFPKWIVTNFGSDIFLFGQLKEHKEKIRMVMKLADYYSCECKRDVLLAREFGFEKEILSVFPNSGILEDEVFKESNMSIIPSKRKKIMLKGYQGWSGRALTAIYALGKCADIMKEYTVMVYNVSEDIKIALELMKIRYKIAYEIIPMDTDRKEIIKHHGQARISIGLNISDGLSTSMIEAMSMGSFIIQSNTSCAHEIIKQNKTGILVDPENFQEVEEALRLALSNDSLVDEAMVINKLLCKKRFSKKVNELKILNYYEKVVNEG